MARKSFSISTNNASVARNSEMVHYAENETTQMIVEVDIDLIEKDSLNDEIYEMSDISALAETIKEQGLKEPLAVYVMPDGSGKYMLASGHRRYLACKEAGLSKVLVRKLPWVDNKNERVIQLITYNRSREKTILESANEVYEYMNSLENVSQTERYSKAEKFFGKSHSVIRRLYGTAELIPELKDKIKDKDKYSHTGICEAVGMSKENQLKFSEQIDSYVEKNGTITHELIIKLAKNIKGEAKGEAKKKSTPKASFQDDANKFVKKCKKQLKSQGTDTIAVLEDTIRQLNELLLETK